MKQVFTTLAVMAGLGAVGGLAVVQFGLFNTSAKGGHWAVTDWAMHTTFENAVALRAPPASETPPLDDPALIELGARHYDSACSMCHGTPGRGAGATIAAMVPPPPPLDRAVAPWTPEEMHWIVEQGVKMTGMPAWPADGRKDEVWAVVAFLMEVQRGMDAARYAQTTAPSSGGYCAACHGAGGTELAPRLDVLTPEYIAASLAAYRSGARPSGIMAHAALRVPASSDRELAAELSRLAGPAHEPMGDPKAGAALAQTGRGDVPACSACHGAANENPLIPSIDGQAAPYIAAQLRLWRDGARGGADRAPLMVAAAKGLEDADIDALAAYFASRPPSSAR